MILFNEVESKETLLLLLTRRLDRFGLRVNQKKTQVWTAEELRRHRFRDLQALFHTKESKKDPDTVAQFVLEYLKIPKDELARSWNAGMPLLNRLLFCNLESLPERLFEPLLDRLTSAEYLLVAGHRELLRIAALNSRSVAPVDIPERLRELSAKCVHNAFHYEVVAFARSAKMPALEASTLTRIDELNALMANED
jgi:hypothetical protein